MTNANILRSYVVKNGYSQESLAKKMHISSNTLSNKINGKTEFTLDEARLLCEILGIESDREKCEIFLT